MKKLVKRAIGTRIERQISRALSAPREFSEGKAIQLLVDNIRGFVADKNFTYQQKYDFFYELNRAILPDFYINDVGRIISDDAEFVRYFERFSSQNWKSFERRWNLRELLRLVESVAGDLAECGVFEGANAHQLCQFAEKYGRKVHLFDSFEGLSAPADSDGSFWKKGDLSASEAVVHRNLSQFKCFETFRGWIPDAFPYDGEFRYAFVHIDVDLEQPTRDSLAFFYPRMNEGGIILLDDHGYKTCPGARKAALAFMADKPEPVIDLSSGQGLIIKRCV